MSTLRTNQITDLAGNILWEASQGIGGAPVVTTSGSQDLQDAFDSRVVTASGITELKTYPVEAGVQVSLTSGSHGVFVWVVGDFTSLVDDENYVASNTDSTPGATGAWVKRVNRMPTTVKFETDGTWTRPEGCTRIRAALVGGGGAGGGAVSTGGSETSTGGGGGAGGGVIINVDVSSLPSLSVTVGDGGVGADGVDGTNGSSSILSSLATASGGTGGSASSAGNTYSGAAAGSGGGASGGEVNQGGQGGGPGLRLGDLTSSGSVSQMFSMSGAGGSAPIYGGSGGGAVVASGAAGGGFSGKNASGYGGGGGGATNGSSSSSKPGGAGAQGIIIITEYYN